MAQYPAADHLHRVIDVMLVLAFLTITAAGQPAPDADSGPIDLTRNETAHLLATCDDLDR